MNYRQLSKNIEKITDEAQIKIEDLAAEFRKQKLIPFCQRHRLTFISGMGTCVFFRGNKAVYSTELKAIKPIEEMLNIRCLSQSDVFLFYVQDVTEENIKLK